MAEENLLQIGTVARMAGVNIQTIRYYERRNLLKPAEKRDSGYRLYTEEAVKAILFIKRAQMLGFKLDEIQELLNLRAPCEGRRGRVRQKAIQKLTDVQKKIQMLKQIESTLMTLIQDCEANETSKTCPIIEEMEINP